MFEGQVASVKRINLLYDDVERNYHVITNLTGAMARKWVCKVPSRTSATRCEATAWPGLRAHSRMFATPAQNVTGILKAASVSPTTSRLPQRKNQYVNESGAVRRVDRS